MKLAQPITISRVAWLNLFWFISFSKYVLNSPQTPWTWQLDFFQFYGCCSLFFRPRNPCLPMFGRCVHRLLYTWPLKSRSRSFDRSLNWCCQAKRFRRSQFRACLCVFVHRNVITRSTNGTTVKKNKTTDTHGTQMWAIQINTGTFGLLHFIIS